MTVIAVMFPWDHKYFEKYEIACYFRHFCTHCLHVAITFQQDCTLNENNCNASLVIDRGNNFYSNSGSDRCRGCSLHSRR